MGDKREKKAIFGFESGFYYYTEKIFDIIALSSLWLLCCLPLITVGAATSALYYTVVKNIRGERGYLVQEFFKAFRTNFKNSTVIWLVIAFLGFLFQLNIGILLKLTGGTIGYIFIAFYLFLLLGVVGILLYGLPAIARLDMNAGWIIKLSLYMTVRYFLTTLILLGILVLTVAAVYNFPYLIFVLPALSCTFSAIFIEKVLQNHMPKVVE